MISAFIGSPGCGKSTALAWVARRATTRPNKPIYICGQCVSEGHTMLFTNFPFDGAYQLDYDNLGKYRYEDALILLDEMSMYSDSRDFKNFSKALLFFYTQHRKSHISIIWASQQYSDSDKKIRGLTTSYFMIEPFLFGFSRFVHIRAYTRLINADIKSGYEWGKAQYFRVKPLYKLFDSYSTLGVDKNSLPSPPLIPWNPDSEDSESDTAVSDSSGSPLPSPAPASAPPALFGSFTVQKGKSKDSDGSSSGSPLSSPAPSGFMSVDGSFTPD